MAQALSLSGDCQILSTRPRLTFRNGSYYYQITRQGNRNIYTVTNGANSISEPLLYCFGLGRVGQTYLFKHNGLLYETRLSYYQQLQGLGFTTGHPRTEPTSLEEALSRPLGTEEVGTCFGCHSTAALNGSQLQLERVIPGVTCEGCHGPNGLASCSAGDRSIIGPSARLAVCQSASVCSRFARKSAKCGAGRTAGRCGLQR